MPRSLPKKSIRRHHLALAVLLLLSYGTPAAIAATRVITDADKGGSIQLKLGDVLEVRLRSNPTTGYSWYVHPRSTPLLKPAGQSQVHARQPGVGRPILQVLRFQAAAYGDGILLLHYVRAWEEPTADEEQYAVRVSIR
jgi:inhibitor of cysteine peptidase